MTTWTLVLALAGSGGWVAIPGYGSKALCQEAIRDMKNDRELYGYVYPSWSFCVRVIGPKVPR